MIAFIRGKLIYKSTNDAVVDVQGVGYHLFIPFPTIERLPEPGGEVELHTYLHVREDALQLFGFAELKEKELFKLLIGVSGVGPRLAHSVMSGLPYPDLTAAISRGDSVRLSKIPGVGRKTADRLIMELREKITSLEILYRESGERRSAENIYTEALLALTTLGYSRNAAETAIRAVVAESNGASLPLEEIIKQALRSMSR